jgi:hypothetical protein
MADGMDRIFSGSDNGGTKGEGSEGFGSQLPEWLESLRAVAADAVLKATAAARQHPES